jgi:hypothetical protein
MDTPSHDFPSTNPESNAARRVLRLGVAAALACLLLFFAGLKAQAQTTTIVAPPRIPGERDDDSTQVPGREEMIKKLEVKRREEAYKENQERAKEGAEIGAELRRIYERTKSLGPAEQKKLGRMEKLTRSIREQAGGDDDEEGSKELPPGLDASFERLQKLSEELQSRVEKTPRHVVSTSVINTANQLLELIRHIRAFFK